MDGAEALEILAELEEVQGQLDGVDAELALTALDRDHVRLLEAFRAVLDAGEADAALRFAAGLRVYLVDRGHVTDGRPLVDAALELAGPRQTELRGRALVTAALLAFRQGDNDAARELFDEALAVARETREQEIEARSLSGLARVEMRAGDFEAVRALASKSVTIWERLGDEVGRAGAFHMLAYANFGDDNWEQARALFQESLDNARRLGYRAYVAAESGNLAAVERELGNLDRSEELTRESLGMAVELGSAYLVPYGLADLGAACARGEYECGARLLAAAEKAFERAGLVMDPGAEPVFRRDVAAAREALGGRFDAEWEAGFDLATEQAVELALETTRAREKH